MTSFFKSMLMVMLSNSTYSTKAWLASSSLKSYLLRERRAKVTNSFFTSFNNPRLCWLSIFETLFSVLSRLFIISRIYVSFIMLKHSSLKLFLNMHVANFYKFSLHSAIFSAQISRMFSGISQNARETFIITYNHRILQIFSKFRRILGTKMCKSLGIPEKVSI